MAYYFISENKNGEYKQLNIEASNGFDIERKFKKPRAHTLQEIDTFTTQFEDEADLKARLIKEGILPSSLAANPLLVKFIKQNNPDSIRYDILYQDAVEYIMEPERLVALILERYHQNDFLFIKHLANRFSNFRECSTTAPEVSRLAQLSINEGKRDAGFDELDLNQDNMVARLIKLIILKHSEAPNGKIQYKDKINYRNLHLLISFVIYYNESLFQENTYIQNSERELSEEVNSCSYARRRVLTPHHYEQLSFKDLKQY